MASYKNIKQYRRKKKLSSFAKKMLIIIVILLVMAVVVNILELFQNTAISSYLQAPDSVSSVEDFPITYKSEQMLDIFPFNDNLAVLSTSAVLVYNRNGNRTYSFIHGYTNPVIRIGDKRVLTYDKGGYKVRVDSSSNNINEIKTDFTILTAKIAENGNIVVVTSHDKYACEVTVYTNTLKQKLFVYYGTNEFSDIAFSPDSKQLAAVSIVGLEGIISTEVYLIDTTVEDDAKTYTIKNLLPLNVDFNGENHIKIVGNNKITTISVDSSEITSYSYKGAIEQFGTIGASETVVVTQNLTDRNSTVTIIDPDGAATASVSTDDEFLDMYCGNNAIMVLTKSSITYYDLQLNVKNKLSMRKSMEKVTFNGSYAFALGGDTIERYDII